MRLSDVLQGLGTPIAYYPGLAKKLGGITEALLVQQILFLMPLGTLKKGWVSKTYPEWMDELAVPEREFRKAKKSLEDQGILETVEDRLNHKMFYRVDTEKLDSVWIASGPGRTECPAGSVRSVRPGEDTPSGRNYQRTLPENTTREKATTAPAPQDAKHAQAVSPQEGPSWLEEVDQNFQANADITKGHVAFDRIWEIAPVWSKKFPGKCKKAWLKLSAFEKQAALQNVLRQYSLLGSIPASMQNVYRLETYLTQKRWLEPDEAFVSSAKAHAEISRGNKLTIGVHSRRTA